MTDSPTRDQAWRSNMGAGQQNFQRGNMAEAARAFSRATELLPDRVEGWINLGSALLEARQFTSAQAALKTAISLQPRIMVAHLLFGDSQRLMANHSGALTSYRQAVALQRAPVALNRLACELRVRDERDEAADLYHEAIRTDPHFTLARVNLATMQIERQQYQQAAEQLHALESETLPPQEQEEVKSTRAALQEYFRLQQPIAAMRANGDTAPLENALADTPKRAFKPEATPLQAIGRYVEWARKSSAPPGAPALDVPEDWPLIEALFMVPMVNSAAEYLDTQERLGRDSNVSGAMQESLNMQAAIEAARNARREFDDPLRAELRLRQWHALACRDLAGFEPGHFKYTKNWTAANPTVQRVQPILASATLRKLVSDYYPKMRPGVARATVVWMALCDLHPFMDGNGRVAMTWLNRELEWAGLMPAIFPREGGLKGELSASMRTMRAGDGDLSELTSIIVRGQQHARECCAELATLRKASA